MVKFKFLKLLAFMINTAIFLSSCNLFKPQEPEKKQEKIQFEKGHPKNFRKAKKILKKLFKEGTEFYCGCDYNLQKDPQIITKNCGFIPKKASSRSKRIEWEHIVPASFYGKNFKEWTEGHPKCVKKGKPYKGRECARKASAEFRKMEADLFNLVPAIGELNSRRGNLQFVEIPSEPREFGKCDFEITRNGVEPRKNIRGDIARVYLYMQRKYSKYMQLSKDQIALFKSWDSQDPPSKYESERIAKLRKHQPDIFFVDGPKELLTH